MLHETMTVSEVAQTKGVSEAAIRFVLNDPGNTSLEGVKVGGRLLVLSQSAESYTPRAYPRMDLIMQLARPVQQRIRGYLEDLAAEMVEEHQLAAHILKHCVASPITHHGKPGFLIAMVPDEDLPKVAPRNSDMLCAVFATDDAETVKRAAKEWALQFYQEDQARA